MASIVREVWQENLEAEISEIKRVLLHHRFAAMDTEFPGQVFPAPRRKFSHLSAEENYSHMKNNVDATQIIQLGLTLSDANGDSCCVWEFNFKDFDKATDLYNASSIELLERQGIDFHKNREKGIDSLDFARLILKSGILHNSNITWVTFHGAFDFGYFIKMLIRRELPSDLMEFMRLVSFFFGCRVFDMKHMIRSRNGFCGGLEREAEKLGVVYREAGKSHQAGSDSLLTLQTMIKLKDLHFDGEMLVNFMLVLYGLQVNVGCLFGQKDYTEQTSTGHVENHLQPTSRVLHPGNCGRKRSGGKYLLQGLQRGK